MIAVDMFSQINEPLVQVSVAAPTSVAQCRSFTTGLWYFGAFTLTMLLHHFGRPW